MELPLDSKTQHLLIQGKLVFAFFHVVSFAIGSFTINHVVNHTANLRPKIIKFLKDNIEENIRDLGLGKNFIDGYENYEA